jgi:hypothetical protein
MTFAGRDGSEVDALRTDRYLEALLAQRDGRAAGAADDARADDAAAPAARGVDPAVGSAIERLGRDLVRVHPSFRFEERLARRLAEVAAAMRVSAAAGAEGAIVPVIPFPSDLADPAADVDPSTAGGQGVRRPVLIGGAVASAAISIAGAAIVAWRLGRPGADPMARAVRAANQLRGTTRPDRLRLD